MPGYDGKGPLGEGPMTGRGRGYCVLELPENGDLPGIVSEVLSEVRETGYPDFSRDDTAQLFIRLKEMQSALKNLDRRIDLLKKRGRKNKRGQPASV